MGKERTRIIEWICGISLLNDCWQLGSLIPCSHDIPPEGPTAFYSRDNWEIFYCITLLLSPQELLIDEIGSAYHYCTLYPSNSADRYRTDRFDINIWYSNQCAKYTAVFLWWPSGLSTPFRSTNLRILFLYIFEENIFLLVKWKHITCCITLCRTHKYLNYPKDK